MAPGTTSNNTASSTSKAKLTALVWLPRWPGPALPTWGWAPTRSLSVCGLHRLSKVAGMAYDVARVRGLHPSLGDGWVHFDAQNGMLLPDSVATTVSTAFRNSMTTTVGPHPSAKRSAAVLDAARQAVADLVNADPRGVILGADRAILLNSLADASSSRVGLGYETVVTRLDDEANIAPWLRAANRYGAKVKWAEVDIETGELPNWQWENLITEATRLVAITSASATLGTVTDLRAATKLMHAGRRPGHRRPFGGRAPYRLIDIDEIDADVVAVNALAWGGPPVGALVFRDPDVIELVRFDRAEPVCHRGRAAGDRRASVPAAGRPRRQHRIPCLP